VDTTNGRVGIGTTTANWKLDTTTVFSTGGATVTFDVSWPTDNHQNVNGATNSAWCFVKYTTDNVNWYHATLISGGSLTPVDGRGAFAQIGTGQTVIWNYTADGLSNTTGVTIKVFALEMVRIPQGSFYVGSGGSETSAFYNYPTTTNSYQITSEGAITVGTATNNLYYASGGNTGDAVGPIPAAFPKGYQAFYIMKYDLTQGQYRDFLNTLTRTQQNQRAGNGTTLASGTTSVTNRYVMSNTTTVSYRNGIRCDATIHATNPIIFYCDLNANGIPNESTDGEFIACNYLSWPDLIAYADWAGLRPMTELEYEKAARGTANPIANEYAFGSATATATASGPTNSGANNEIATNSANCLYSGGIQGPIRSGFAATSSSLRYNAGASFYGVMELSGNLWKRPVTVGNATGRAFTGLHGNGALDASGNADVSLWPGTGATGSGYRGGSWYYGATYARVSDRYYAALTNAVRDNNYGVRLARTSP
jgi:formylglycine-generating enzyme required for sulfatase activity